MSKLFTLDFFKDELERLAEAPCLCFVACLAVLKLLSFFLFNKGTKWLATKGKDDIELQKIILISLQYFAPDW